MSRLSAERCSTMRVTIEYYSQHNNRHIRAIITESAVSGGGHLDVSIEHDDDNHMRDRDYRFDEAILRGLTSSATVDELAAICCESCSTFKRHFRARYSLSPHRWFTEHKLQMAYNMVRSTTISTKDISRLCSFGCPSRFVHLFHQRYGITPMRLRREQGSDATYEPSMEIVIEF